MTERWSTWSGSATSHPVRLLHPASTAEVVEAVRAARAEGLPVKAYGAGHSFTPIAATDGVMLRLDRMNHLLAHDTASGQVRVQAGMSLHELNPQLDAIGLALPNLGDVDPQSVAGAVSTGTHGTGATLHGIAATVIGVQLVTAEGDVVEIDESHPWFGAARISLGALGIVTELTLQCVPAFLLHAREEPMPLPEVLERLPELLQNHDHMEFYWFPHTEKALLKRNDRVPPGTEREPVGRIRHLVDDELLSNGAFELVNRVAARRPSWIPRINQWSGSALSAREYIDRSYEVFVSPRRVRFRESEFAMPRAALPDVIRELQAWFDAGHEAISFPIEVRFTAADDVWMSTGHERDNCYVAVHQYHRTDPTAYFAAAQDVFTAHEGRPHWGKMHTLGADYLSQRYARFDDFVAVRDEADPRRTFSNAYLDRVLG
ncbi:D-arabinono-1,4-lactone oxidase [Aeromicrobium terrae]|uniref:FAD-binding protein n=1 Tax=Aeromicrobium terrae TaxID=2498846 RepID=A0A5C8NKE4_9ACTN|nr:D-arabinono-1,4-lactone oxidase [Aeromicrobium terrae]TXL62239.1 FAD-binding protein [Aeromicrobium terrae]